MTTGWAKDSFYDRADGIKKPSGSTTGTVTGTTVGSLVSGTRRGGSGISVERAVHEIVDVDW